MNEDLKILLVGKETPSRDLMSEIVKEIPGTSVTEPAATPRMALARLRGGPVDMLLLDLESLAKPNILEMMKKIRTNHPDADVVIVARVTENRVDEIVEALEMGAADFVPKPVIANENSIREFRLRLLTLIGLLGSRRNFRMAARMNSQAGHVAASLAGSRAKGGDALGQKKTASGSEVRSCSEKPRGIPGKIDVVAIAVSTGGPNALAEVIPRLPLSLDVPVLIVQHIPASFTAPLANSLNLKSLFSVKEARDGERVLPNIAYIASGGQHMVVRKEKDAGELYGQKRIRLLDTPPENSVRPSADVLFRSLPDAYEWGILLVIMTGMGHDGTKGVRHMKCRGSHYCLSQTAETCTVYGMPRSVDEAGLSDEKVPLSLLAERITHIVQGG